MFCDGSVSSSVGTRIPKWVTQRAGDGVCSQPKTSRCNECGRLWGGWGDRGAGGGCEVHLSWDRFGYPNLFLVSLQKGHLAPGAVWMGGDMIALLSFCAGGGVDMIALLSFCAGRGFSA